MSLQIHRSPGRPSRTTQPNNPAGRGSKDWSLPDFVKTLGADIVTRSSPV
jgi:hypothetical protein